MRKRLTISVIAVFFIAAGIGYSVFVSSSNESQSEIKKILEPLLKAQKVTFNIEISTAGDLPSATMQGMYKLPSKSRLSFGEDFIIWNDFAKSEYVMLSQYSRTVRVINTCDPGTGLGFDLLSIRNSLEKIFDDPKATFKAVGKDSFNGKNVVIYKIQSGDLDLIYWSDPESRVPVKIISSLNSKQSSVKTVITSIDVAPILGDNLLDVQIPDGYIVEKVDKMVSADSSEAEYLSKKSTELLELNEELYEAQKEYESIPSDQPDRKKAAKEKMFKLAEQLKTKTNEVQSLINESKQHEK